VSDDQASRIAVHRRGRAGRFSFGAAIAANLARRLGPRVTHLCLVSPGGFPTRRFGDRPTRSYKEAGGDERLFREICRHNLLVNMLSDPASVTEETVDIQAECVRARAGHWSAYENAPEVNRRMLEFFST
jgi:pimeloyl-ACP methyl ester carboxylesterase